jgi:hypothetical protein
MTPKEQAEELVNKYMNLNKVKLSDYSVIYTPTAKQCALIAVKFAKENPLNTDGYNKYLQEVEQEIEKL